MTGDELRRRIRRLGLSYTAAAPRLGLSPAGLHHNLRDEGKITRQTEIILEMLEREQGRRTPPKSAALHQEPAPATKPRRRPRLVTA
jgi:hypothetical protein